MLHLVLAALSLFTSSASACLRTSECPFGTLCYSSSCRGCSVGSLCTGFAGCCDGLYCSSKGRCARYATSSTWKYWAMAAGVIVFLVIAFLIYSAYSRRQKQQQQQQFQPVVIVPQQQQAVYGGQYGAGYQQLPAYNNQSQYQTNQPNYPPPK